MIVDRREMRDKIADVLALLTQAENAAALLEAQDTAAEASGAE
jgi:hypothetical protein